MMASHSWGSTGMTSVFRAARRGFAVLLLICLGSTPALARHHHHGTQASSPAVAGQFDYYLLSLSWSPSYCLTHPEDQAQCGGRGYGFVLHGLWPQYLRGGYPENCAAGAELTAEARRTGESLYPSPKLVAHEWQRHGTCSGMDAAGYFRTADRALAAVQVPRTALSMSAARVQDAFHAANPHMPADGMIVACRGAELSEVRVCLSRALELTSCGRGVRDSCPAVALRVPASR
jgi:ribonuclease T2